MALFVQSNTELLVGVHLLVIVFLDEESHHKFHCTDKIWHPEGESTLADTGRNSAALGFAGRDA